jgi:hypothetical protein
MAKAEATVEELVTMIERGELRLPEMQRRYVWRAPRVRDLLDSLYRGYPSGAILLWETDDNITLQAMAVEQQTSAFQTRRLLLDGQQRLTSLSAVIRSAPVTVRGRKKPIELLFNLEHPDDLVVVTEVLDDDDDDDDDLIEDEADSTEDELLERFNRMTFVVSTRKLERLPHWVRVSDIFKADSDAPLLQEAGVTGFDDPRYKKYSERLARVRAIRKYSYRMDVLERTLGYEEVTEIFVRVNSLGAKLRSSDLALAQITAKWPGALATFQDFEKKCAKLGFDLDLGLLLKGLVVFATGQSRFATIGSQPVARLKDGWKQACDGMEFALNFVRSNAGIDSPVLLSSPFLLIALAYFGSQREYHLTPTESDRLRYWVLIANAKGRYSRGSSETILDQDLSIIRRKGGLEGLLDVLRQQVGRLDITPEELEGRSQQSALFKTMFLAFRSAGAKDWKSKLAISVNHAGSHHRLQFHHIFPKALLKQKYTKRETDDIANLCFIAGKTNRQISDNPPAEYLKATLADTGRAALDAQCIPSEPELLETSSYKGFLHARRERIAARLNAFLGS